MKAVLHLFHAMIFGLVLVGAPVSATNGTAQTSVMQSEAQRTQIEEKTFFESPMGVQIAWFSSIVGVILGLIPLGLYFQERKKSKLLNAVLDQYAIALKIEADAQRATTAKTTTDEALQVSKQELAELTRQLEHTIPIQARAAFFQAALPEVDRQILYLQEQRRAMEARLAETGVAVDDSSRLKPILQAEINQTVMARRLLDEKQTVLSIFAGLAAGSAAFTLFGPLIFPIRLALGVAIVWAVVELGRQWAIVYPENKLARFIARLSWRKLLLIFGCLVLISVLFVVIIVMLN